MVEERRVSVDELYEAAKNGTMEEVFGTGTAAVISPELLTQLADAAVFYLKHMILEPQMADRRDNRRRARAEYLLHCAVLRRLRLC